MEKEFLTERDDIFVIRGFFDDEACQRHIEKCESLGFGEATVNTSVGAIVNTKMRSNERVIVDDIPAAFNLWEKFKLFIPDAYGVNERFRYYRYEPGQYFDWHFDAPYQRNARERSKLTLMIYLNDDFTGGTTDFVFQAGVIREDDPVFQVKPEKGMAFLFTHNVLHRGAKVLSGKKYVLRSDVMYKG